MNARTGARRWLVPAMGVSGVVLCALGVAAAVLAGGVPFHDGPNAGFGAPPGFRRAVIVLVLPAIAAGVLLLVATGALLLVAAWRRVVAARRPRPSS